MVNADFGTEHLIPNFFRWVFDKVTFGHGDIGGSVILLFIGYLSFLMFKDAKPEHAFAVSGGITTLLSFFFVRLGWVGNTTFVVCAVVFVVGIFFLMKESSKLEA